MRHTQEIPKDIRKWLAEGEQSKVTPTIRKIVKKIDGEGIQFILNMLSFLKEKFRHFGKDEWASHFRTRTADEILKSKKISGCGDTAVIFCTLIRAKGIPAKFVELPHESWLRSSKTDVFENHCLAQVFIEGKWYWVDPSRGNIGVRDPSAVGGGINYVILAEGLDSWDIDIDSWKNYKKKYLKFRAYWQKKNRKQ